MQQLMNHHLPPMIPNNINILQAAMSGIGIQGIPPEIQQQQI
jgi:hypothetical protein